MTTTTKRVAMLERIERHGRQLLAIFPNATERDPVKLCKQLRRWEMAGNVLGLRLCNGPAYSSPEAEEQEGERILSAVRTLLGCRSRYGVTIFLNRDPRGYALKIHDDVMKHNKLELYRDWGGYGIIAPDLSEDS